MKESITSKKKIITIVLVAVVMVAIIVAVIWNNSTINRRVDFMFGSITGHSKLSSYVKETSYPEMKDRTWFEKRFPKKLNAHITGLSAEGDNEKLLEIVKRLEELGYENESTKSALDTAFNKYIEEETKKGIRSSIKLMKTFKEFDDFRFFSKTSDLLSIDEIISTITSNAELAIIENDKGGYYDDNRDEYQNKSRSERIGVVANTKSTKYTFYGDFVAEHDSETFRDTIRDSHTAANQKELNKMGSSVTRLRYKDSIIVDADDKFFDMLKRADEIKGIYAIINSDNKPNENFIIYITNSGFVCLGDGNSLEYTYK